MREINVEINKILFEMLQKYYIIRKSVIIKIAKVRILLQNYKITTRIFQNLQLEFINLQIK